MNFKSIKNAIILFVTIALLAVLAEILILIFMRYPHKNPDTKMHTPAEYDKMQHDIDSVHNAFYILQLKLKASDAHTDSLDNYIKNLNSFTTKTTTRKHETLQIIHNSTPTHLDSVMSTVHIKANHN